MIQVVEKPYTLSQSELDRQFEDRMVVLVRSSENSEYDLIVAHSDGNKATEDEDRNSLLDIIWYKYKGKGKLTSGFVYDGSNFVCI
jgi:hypothetical protein